jgi:hypothetical protein
MASISKTPLVSTETSSKSNSQNIQPTINYNNYDDLGMNNIRNLIQAEGSRDFNSIYSYMSSSVERYWAAANPSQVELLKRYTSVWNGLESSSNTINEIETIDNNTFDLHTAFTYTGKKPRNKNCQ